MFMSYKASLACQIRMNIRCKNEMSYQILTDIFKKYFPAQLVLVPALSEELRTLCSDSCVSLLWTGWGKNIPSLIYTHSAKAAAMAWTLQRRQKKDSLHVTEKEADGGILSTDRKTAACARMLHLTAHLNCKNGWKENRVKKKHKKIFCIFSGKAQKVRNLFLILLTTQPTTYAPTHTRTGSREKSGTFIKP